MKISKPISATYGLVTGVAELGHNLTVVGNIGLDVLASDLRLEKQKSTMKEELYRTDGFKTYQKISAKSELIRNELEFIKDSELDEETQKLLESQLLEAFQS